MCIEDFDNMDATVVCRQLGLGTSGIAVTDRRFGDGRGSIWVSGLKCHGNESNINACKQGILGVNTCNHWEDVGVICIRKCNISCLDVINLNH